ncbi:hypothetical protein RHMOL_Rhmol13G0179500 [Rhododendron molle]|uniref:Uncharacterized protein n=1 Tax=Rhododendron molle TaxID=49168 RepID=A0ACC0L8W1_RHOML|nr:hypothetical protein RHMOL_Rhmol13G0179500 [Rhododendron molle]
MAREAEWIAQHEQMAINPLDGFSLYMLFQQPQPQVPEEEYFWDPEPVWQFPVDSFELLQGYISPEHMTHFSEDDLVQKETRVLGECFLPSTINRLVASVADPAYDPVLNIIDEDQPRPVVFPPKDCSVMVTGLVPPADLWNMDEIVDVQVGAEVWAVNCSLAEGGLWDVPFTTNSEPAREVAAIPNLNFWDSLLMKDLAKDLGLNTEAPVAALPTDKGKRKLGEVPSDLWDVNQDPQAMPSLGNVLNVTRSGRIFQPVNLQAGTSSNPSNQRNESIPFLPKKLCHTLTHLEVQANVTPEAMVSLILPPTAKHTVVFTDKDLPIEGTDHVTPQADYWPNTLILTHKPHHMAQKLKHKVLVVAYKEDGTPVLGIMHGEKDVDLGGFSFDTFGSVLAINVDGDFLISFVAMDIMLRMSYFPGLGLGIHQQGVPEFPTFPSSEGCFGLGYFVREVGNAAYTRQSEPFINPETGELLPGFEVFADDTWSESDDKPARIEFKRKLNQPKAKTDWLGTFDQGSLELFFQKFSQVGLAKEAEEAEVLMLGPDALEDPTALISEAKGSVKNCIFKPRLTCIDDTSESESESTFISSLTLLYLATRWGLMK